MAVNGGKDGNDGKMTVIDGKHTTVKDGITVIYRDHGNLPSCTVGPRQSQRKGTPNEYILTSQRVNFAFHFTSPLTSVKTN